LPGCGCEARLGEQNGTRGKPELTATSVIIRETLLGRMTQRLRVFVTLFVAMATAIVSRTAELPKTDHHFLYTNDVIDDIPWSIHIVRIERSYSDFEFCTTLGRGETFGMGTVSEQLKSVTQAARVPLAAINGDFYEKSEKYQGRPRDVQLWQGEVVSSPAGHTAFWIDVQGVPQMTNVFSRFRALWPDGRSTPIGLNQDRDDQTAVLYTAVAGPSTRTAGGVDLVLEPASKSAWLPLKVGSIYEARIKAVRESGNAPLTRDTMVLSLGPKLLSSLPSLSPGSSIRISTETSPDLSGATVAIAGGPALVHNHKPLQWTGFLHMRHPRSAFGWNKEYYFLVEVDGRQSNISVGMTFPELADYLVKLGCDEAMNFDGGGSATLWALGAVRNSPSEGDERPSANALVVVRKKPGPDPKSN
jgi:hypothetical protein